jgi:hypothetical protein
MPKTDLKEFFGTKKYHKFERDLEEAGKSKGVENLARTVLNQIGREIDEHNVFKKKADVLTPEFIALEAVLMNSEFLAFCKAFGARKVTLLSVLIKILFREAIFSREWGLTVLSCFSSPGFVVFCHQSARLFKDTSHIVEMTSLLRIAHQRNQPEIAIRFSASLGDDLFLKFANRYQKYLDEFCYIAKRYFLLMLAYPKRAEHIRFLRDYMMNLGFFHWVELFYRETVFDVDRKKISPSQYIVELMFNIIVMGKANSDFKRFFETLTSPINIVDRLPRGKKISFLAITRLINASIYFADSRLAIEFTNFYVGFNRQTGSRREIFTMVTAMVLSDDMPGPRKKPMLAFYNGREFEMLVKKWLKTSPTVVLFFSRLSLYSLQFAVEEYFKTIEEEKLMEVMSKLHKKDRFFQNYIELFKYLEINLHSTALRNRVIVFFYFHFAQVARAQSKSKSNNESVNFNWKEMFFLNHRHRKFTEIISSRYYFLKTARGGNSSQGTEDDEENKLARKLLMSSSVPAHEQAYFAPEPDFDNALMVVREDVLADIFKNKTLQKEESLALKYLLDLATNRRAEDELYEALDAVVVNNDLKPYELFIRQKFLEDPHEIYRYFGRGAFYSMQFRDCRKELMRILLPVVRLIPIKPSEWAKTDSKNIYLPTSIFEFPDKIDGRDIILNRNFSLYVYLGLHEFSHLYSRSFEFDFRGYLEEQTSNLSTAFHFFNLIEDYRSEKVLLSADFIEPYREVILESRKYYGKAGFSGDPATRIAKIIMGEIYWDKPYEEIVPESAQEIRDFKSIEVLSETLQLRKLANYGQISSWCVDHIKNMRMDGSKYSIYLAVEFYKIMSEEFNMDNLDFRHLGIEHGESGEAHPGDAPAYAAGPSQGGKSITGSGRADEKEKGDANGNQNESGAKPEQNAEPGKNGKRASEGDQPLADVPSTESRPTQNVKMTADEKKAYLKNLYQGFEQGLRQTTEPDSDEAPPHVIDNSRRTQADNDAAEAMLRQVEEKREVTIKPGDVSELRRKSDQEILQLNRKRRRKKKGKSVLSYNSAVKGYTDVRDIELYTIRATDPSFNDKLRRYLYIVDRVREEIALILPQTEGQVVDSDAEGELNDDRFVEVFAGNMRDRPMPEIFRHVVYKDLSEMQVIIGLDASGSTSTEVDDGLTVLDVEKIFANLFGRIFEEFTPHVSYYAFNSMSATNIYHFPRAENLSSLVSDFGSRDGDFIRYINKILNERSAAQRYFFLLSDGAPTADNYSGDSAIDDTVMAMSEVLNSGTKLIYFNIDKNASAYFEKFVAASTYAENFRNPVELLDKVGEMAVEMLTGLGN